MSGVQGRVPGLFSGSVANFLGLSLPLILGAYSIPLIIARLGIERFGTLTLVWALIGYFSLLDFGISRALTKRVAELGDQPGLGEAIRSGLLLLLGLGLFVGLALGGAYLLAESWGFLRPDQELRNSAWLMALSMPFVLFGLGQRGVLEGRQRFVAANWGRVILGIAAFGAPIPLLALYPRLDVLVAALVAGRLLTMALQGWACRAELGAAWRAPFDRQEMLALLHFGSWMMVSNLVSPLMVFLDRFLVGASPSAASLAYYTTPFEVVTRLLIVPGAVTTSLFPKLAQWGVGDKDSAVQGMVRGMGLMIVLVLPLVLALQLFAADLLQLWLGTEFATQATLPMRILAWGVLFNSLAAFPFAFLQGMGKPRWIALLHLVELPMYLLMLMVFLHQWGIVGVAAAWLIRAAVDGMMLSVLAARYAEAGQNRRVVQIIGCALVVGCIGLLADLGGAGKLMVWLGVCALAAGFGWRIVRMGKDS
jgi:O-antigen/teichoic acid export membrane protein